LPSSKSPLQLLNDGHPTPRKPGVTPCDASLTCCQMHSNRIKIQACTVSEFNGYKSSLKRKSKKETEDNANLSTIRRKVLWNTVLFPALPISVANAIDISSQATPKENEGSLAEDPFAAFGKSLKSDPLSPATMSLGTLPAQSNKKGDSQQGGSDSSAPSLSLDEAVKEKAKKKVIDPRTHG